MSRVIKISSFGVHVIVTNKNHGSLPLTRVESLKISEGKSLLGRWA